MSKYNYKKERPKIVDKQLFEHGYTFCQHCNSSDAFKFHVHHIVFRSEKPNHTHINYPLNLIIVCDSCHNDFHANKGLRNKLVRDRELYEVFGTDILNK
jgi:5-methylcytosine-specific restriction endonuclease McrA